MKVIYVSVSGRAYAEDMNPNIAMVDEPDGLHPMQPSNVWRNDEQKIGSFGPDDSIAVIWQGITSPESYGDGITKEFVDRQMKDDFVLKLHLSKTRISKYITRILMTYVTTGAMLFFFFGILITLSMLLYALGLIFLV
jgi:hypothetical protein